MTNEEEKKIREEFRNYCNTDNFSTPPSEYQADTIADYFIAIMKARDGELLWRIEKDLDAGMFYKICSNETTFKKYILALLTPTTNKSN